MVAHPKADRTLLASALAEGGERVLAPYGALRRLGVALFPSRLARNGGCVLDADLETVSWTRLPLSVRNDTKVDVQVAWSRVSFSFLVSNATVHAAWAAPPSGRSPPSGTGGSWPALLPC